MTDEVILSWRGDPDLKAKAVAAMRRHRAEDRFMQGYYVTFSEINPNQWVGCFHGCLTLEAVAAERGVPVRQAEGLIGDWYAEGYRLWGIPSLLGELLDDSFESFESREDAGDWAVAITEAIPVGVDLIPLARKLWEPFDPDDEDHSLPTPRELLDQLAALS